MGGASKNIMLAWMPVDNYRGLGHSDPRSYHGAGLSAALGARFRYLSKLVVAEVYSNGCGSILDLR